MSKPLHFRHLGKTAGTSIMAWLETYALERLPWALQRRFFLGTHTPWDLRCPDRPSNLITFASVRDPEPHVRSLYRQYHDRKLKPSLNEWIQSEFWTFATSEEMLKDCQHILRFESIQEDWLKFCKEVKLPQISLPHHRNQKHLPKPKDKLSEASKSILRQHYEYTIKNFYPNAL